MNHYLTCNVHILTIKFKELCSSILNKVGQLIVLSPIFNSYHIIVSSACVSLYMQHFLLILTHT